MNYIKHSNKWVTLVLLLSFCFNSQLSASTAKVSHKIERQRINALYIPLADHYAAIVAYHRYAEQMIYADFKIHQMKNWDLLRAYFYSGKADMAYVMSPLAMDMFTEKPDFRWIGLLHRDGSALAINDLLRQQIKLPVHRKDRKPNNTVAFALQQAFNDSAKAIEIGLPHLLSTHSVVLYKYLKEHHLRLSLSPNIDAEILAITIAPPKSPAFLRSKNNRAQYAAFEQSLPWADVVETGKFGHIAWYSKDVMPWPGGHVECIALAKDEAIHEKPLALREVMKYIQIAGEDIEKARNEGGVALEKIVDIVRKYIPAHTRESIIASLDPELRAINYQSLNVDKAGLKLIMDLAVEGGILKQPINIDDFVDEQFSFDLREHLEKMSQPK